MKNAFHKLGLKCYLLSIFIILATSHQVFAATDTVNTLQDLQTRVSTAMYSRSASYNVIYTGDMTTIETDLSKIVYNIWDSDDYSRHTSKGFGCSYTMGKGSINITYTFFYWNTLAMDSYVSTRVTDTATTADGGYKSTSTITVKQGVSSIILDKTSAYAKLGGSDLTLTATVSPTTVTDKRLTWSSSNTNVATVDSNGVVHAIAIGTAVNTVSSVQDPSKLTRCTIIVTFV